MNLVVCFPGIGYHCDKPLLYYGRRVAESVGYKEYKNVEYVNRIGNVKGDPAKMQATFEDLYGQTEEILKDIDFSGYDSILFLSKSVGTIIATTYAERHKIPCRHVLYTPLEATFDNCASNLSGRAIAFTGTEDPWVESTDAITDRCQKAGIPVHVIEEANHSLETADVWKNLNNLEKIMAQTADFISR